MLHTPFVQAKDFQQQMLQGRVLGGAALAALIGQHHKLGYISHIDKTVDSRFGQVFTDDVFKLAASHPAAACYRLAVHGYIRGTVALLIH